MTPTRRCHAEPAAAAKHLGLGVSSASPDPSLALRVTFEIARIYARDGRTFSVNLASWSIWLGEAKRTMK